MDKGKRAASAKKSVGRYCFRKTTMNDRRASDGIVRQLEEESRFRKLLRGLALRRLTRIQKARRLKAASAAATASQKTTSDATSTSCEPQPTCAASLSTPAGTVAIVAGCASTSTNGPRPTTSAAPSKESRMVTFATAFASSTTVPTVAASTTDKNNMKRTKKIMSKGARRKIRQQQIEEQRSSSGEETDTEKCQGKQIRKKRQRKRTSSVVPPPSRSTSANAQQQIVASTSPDPSPNASPVKLEVNENRPLVKFVADPPEKKMVTQVSYWNGKRYVCQFPVESDSDSTDC